MLQLSDGCLTSELLFSVHVNRLTADPTDVAFFGSDVNIAVTVADGVYLVELASLMISKSHLGLINISRLMW